jgi:UDP-N-acetylmuramoyl-L-alanyl-D-glutamate--2,6-diaminopimelate ligase
MVSASSARCYAYGFEGEGTEPNSGGDAFWGKDMILNASSIRYQVEGRDLSSGLSGKFNAYNTLAVYAAGRLLGKGAEDLQRVMQYLTPPSGRMQSVKGPDGRLGMVDYAHTPDALEQVLLTLKGIAGKGVRIITVIGCGGDRDRGKRPLMAAIAYKHSDALVLTSDNPRNEDPEQILNEMMTGIPDHAIVNGTSGVITESKTLIRQTDRAEAIRIAVQWTALGDMILVAGKGHETYQEIAGIRYPFDDVKILQEQFEHLEQLPESSSTKS